MASTTDQQRRVVATLIVLLLAVQACSWLWRQYQRAQNLPPPQAAALALERKIAASHAYDNALLRADVLLNQQDTTAASRLLDSLQQQPTSGLFQIETQKLRATMQRLDSVRANASAIRRQQTRR